MDALKRILLIALPLVLGLGHAAQPATAAMLECISASGPAFLNTPLDASRARSTVRSDPIVVAYYDGSDTLYVWAHRRRDGLSDRAHLEWHGRHSLHAARAAVKRRADAVALRAIASRSSASTGAVVLISRGLTQLADHHLDGTCLRPDV
jgi:hypothetical protein